jgi:hypothetical protein
MKKCFLSTHHPFVDAALVSQCWFTGALPETYVQTSKGTECKAEEVDKEDHMSSEHGGVY